MVKKDCVTLIVFNVCVAMRKMTMTTMKKMMKIWTHPKVPHHDHAIQMTNSTLPTTIMKVIHDFPIIAHNFRMILIECFFIKRERFRRNTSGCRK